ncbi:hypothetical protein BJ508DRAFT_313597 [Ascobolus immersus RN42]|uniref:Uncharacterized protein n=1 Tax=Ascobolus immersus RN42 TaxID=1160509 RepID=A0A3N4HKC6_ASCIM|nr:hypothetical protein BJ508DRAFT_313597 [Ascobolus immersus RN42]
MAKSSATAEETPTPPTGRPSRKKSGQTPMGPPTNTSSSNKTPRNTRTAPPPESPATPAAKEMTQAEKLERQADDDEGYDEIVKLLDPDLVRDMNEATDVKEWKGGMRVMASQTAMYCRYLPPSVRQKVYTLLRAPQVEAGCARDGKNIQEYVTAQFLAILSDYMAAMNVLYDQFMGTELGMHLQGIIDEVNERKISGKPTKAGGSENLDGYYLPYECAPEHYGLIEHPQDVLIKDGMVGIEWSDHTIVDIHKKCFFFLQTRMYSDNGMGWLNGPHADIWLKILASGTLCDFSLYCATRLTYGKFNVKDGKDSRFGNALWRNRVRLEQIPEAPKDLMFPVPRNWPNRSDFFKKVPTLLPSTKMRATVNALHTYLIDPDLVPYILEKGRGKGQYVQYGAGTRANPFTAINNHNIGFPETGDAEDLTACDEEEEASALASSHEALFTAEPNLEDKSKCEQLIEVNSTVKDAIAKMDEAALPSRSSGS